MYFPHNSSCLTKQGKIQLFCKKSIPLHSDEFLLKGNGTVKKLTYFTTVYRRDQDIKDSLSLGGCVVKFERTFVISKNCIIKTTMLAVVMEIPIFSQFIKFISKIPLH